VDRVKTESDVIAVSCPSAAVYTENLTYSRASCTDVRRFRLERRVCGSESHPSDDDRRDCGDDNNLSTGFVINFWLSGGRTGTGSVVAR